MKWRSNESRRKFLKAVPVAVAGAVGDEGRSRRAGAEPPAR